MVFYRSTYLASFISVETRTSYIAFQVAQPTTRLFLVVFADIERICMHQATTRSNWEDEADETQTKRLN